MAQIQTYDANPIAAVAPEKTGFSATGAVLQGVGQALGEAGQAVSTVEKAQKAADANNLFAESTNTLQELDNANKRIKDKYSNNPDPKKMTEELEKEFNRITSSTMPGLDESSLNDYRKVASNAFFKMKDANNNWAEQQAEKLARIRARELKKKADDVNTDLAYQAGFSGSNYQIANNIIMSSGGKTTDAQGNENLALLGIVPDGAKKEDVVSATQKYFAGAIDGMPSVDLMRVEGYVEIDDNGVITKKPESIYVQEGGKIKDGELLDAPSWVSRRFGANQKTYKNRIEAGKEMIDDYYTNINDKITKNAFLSDTQKKSLKAKANLIKEDRKKRFEEQERNYEDSLIVGAAYNPDIEMIDSVIEATIRGENRLNGYEFSPISAENTTNSLFNMSVIKAKDNPELAYGFNPKSVPMSAIAAALNGNMIIGEFTEKELRAKYAPDNTPTQLDILNKLIAGSPYLKIRTGIEWQADGGFDENDWVLNTLSSINAMPEETDEQKAAKTFAIGEALTSGRKLANGGNGFINKETQKFFEESLMGDNWSEEGLIGNTGIGADMREIYETARIAKLEALGAWATGGLDRDGSKLSEYKKLSQTETMLNSMLNTGLQKARRSYLETGRTEEGVRILNKTKKDMLQYKYRDVLDIQEAENAKAQGRQVIFTYNGQPYEFINITGGKIYVRVGGLTKAL